MRASSIAEDVTAKSAPRCQIRPLTGRPRSAARARACPGGGRARGARRRARAAGACRACAHQGVVGARASSRSSASRSAARAVPTSRRSGVELKTVPVTPALVPLESTAVCQIDPIAIAGESWETSYVRASWRACCSWRSRSPPGARSVGDRRVAAVTLWAPDADEEAALRADFELFVREYFRRGRAAEITGHLGARAAGAPEGPRLHRSARRLRRGRATDTRRQVRLLSPPRVRRPHSRVAQTARELRYSRAAPTLKETT